MHHTESRKSSMKEREGKMMEGRNQENRNKLIVAPSGMYIGRSREAEIILTHIDNLIPFVYTLSNARIDVGSR